MEVAPADLGAAGRVRRRRAVRVRRRVRPLLLAPLYAAYTRRLRRRVAAAALPRHVAVILDGNRRWASLAGLAEPGAGHRHGADKLDELLAWCARLGIPELTVWGLSSENLARPSGELQALQDVLTQKLAALAAEGRDGGRLRVRVFGRLDALPAQLAATARRAQEETATAEGLCLNVALGYSGRDELVDATRSLVAALAASGVAGEQMAAQIDAAAIERHLYTADHSDPDLIIRTSGEMRLSGFLPWQSSHSEFYFTDVYWPDFRELDFLRAVRTYQARERRFGR